MMKEFMTIGNLAKASGVGVETIRFYERKGILKQPEKQGGFRYYHQDFIGTIQFIKRAQELGFTLKEAKNILDMSGRTKTQCGDVLSQAEQKILEIDQKIKDLKKMKKSLKEIASCCEDRTVTLDKCPVLNCFVSVKR